MTQVNGLELAKTELLTGDYALVIVKDGEVLFASKENSIGPIYQAVRQFGKTLEGASAADKVVGKAAALFCKTVGIKAVFARLISETAVEILTAAGIELEFDKSCPYILNRTRDGMCPIERLALDVDDGMALLEKVGRFLGDIR